jgi:hypothetical protein
MLYEARLKEWRDNQSRIEGALAECEAKHQRQMRELFSLLESGVPLAETKLMNLWHRLGKFYYIIGRDLNFISACNQIGRLG